MLLGRSGGPSGRIVGETTTPAGGRIPQRGETRPDPRVLVFLGGMLRTHAPAYRGFPAG